MELARQSVSRLDRARLSKRSSLYQPLKETDVRKIANAAFRVLEKSGILYMVPQAPMEDLKGTAVKTPVKGYREKDDRY